MPVKNMEQPLLKIGPRLANKERLFSPYRMNCVLLFWVALGLTIFFGSVTMSNLFLNGTGLQYSLAVVSHGGCPLTEPNCSLLLKNNDVDVYPLFFTSDVVAQKEEGKKLFGHKIILENGLRELRGMVAVPGWNLLGDLIVGAPTSLFVLEAYKGDSKIWLYENACEIHDHGGMHVWAQHPLMIHPYGIAMGAGSIWVTTQDTDLVMRFPLHDPQNPEIFAANISEPRAVAVSERGQSVFIAARGVGQVYRYGLVSKKREASVDLFKPVGLLYLEKEDAILVGQRGSGSGPPSTWGCIHMFKASNLEHIRTYHSPYFRHPGSFQLLEGKLYVAVQGHRGVGRGVIQLDLESGSSRMVVNGSHGKPETVAILPCKPSRRI